MAADAVDHALTIPAMIGAQRFSAAGRCKFDLQRRLGVDSARAPAEIFLVDAGDLLERTRVEHGPRGVSQLWTYAASKGGVVRYGSDVRKRYLDSFPILLGPTADRAAVAERERRFREFLAACEWRF